MIFSLAIDSDNYKFCFFNCIFVNRWQLAVNSAQCLLSRISPTTRLLAIILIVVFCLYFASAVCKTFVEDIAEESREEENYENLRKRLSVPVTVRVPLHNAGRGRRIGGGWRQEAVCETKEQELRCTSCSWRSRASRCWPRASSKCSSASTASTAVQLLPLRHRQRHRRLPASAQVAAGARPGSPVRWRIRMKHW